MKKIILAFISITIVFTLSACGSGSKTMSVKGDLLEAEIPEGWKLVNGKEACGNEDFDFIYCDNNIGNNYFTILRDTQDLKHYKAMIDTNNYGKLISTEKIGEGKWYITEKIAVGPVGKYTCVVQGYDVDLNSDEVKDVLASIKWLDK